MKSIARTAALLAIAFLAPHAITLARADNGYWDTHGLVYAEVKTVAEPKPGTPKPSIVLRPKLTLSGRFDAGKTPEVSAAVETSNYAPSFRLPSAGQMVLVVLAKSGDKYIVSPTRVDFMPGDHFPICAVKDFDDPKVHETLTAVQKLRHAINEAAPGDAPTKQ